MSGAPEGAEPCTASITSDVAGGAMHCVLPAGHEDPEHGNAHAGPGDPFTRLRWFDWAEGATPHQLNPHIACAVVHTDAQGNRIPCPGYPHTEALESGEPDRHPALTTKLYGSSAEDRLRAAEIRAAVAEHEAEAYRNQVQALVRELLRARDVPEEDLPQKVRVIILDEESP